MHEHLQNVIRVYGVFLTLENSPEDQCCEIDHNFQSVWIDENAVPHLSNKNDF